MADPLDWLDRVSPAPLAAPKAAAPDPLSWLDRVSPSTEPVKEQPGLMSDTGNLLNIGIQQGGMSAHDILRRFTPNVIKGVDAITQWRTGKNSDEIMRENLKVAQEHLTPETQAAMQKNWWEDSDDGTPIRKRFGEAWGDPRAYLSAVVPSIPGTVATMGPTGMMARGAFRIGIAGGLTREQAAAKAATTAYMSGAVLEGLQQAGQSGYEVRDKILALPADKLKDSVALKVLMDDGGLDFEAARAKLAEDASAQAMLLSGVTTGIFGGAGDRFLARAFTRGIKGGITTRVAKGVVSEGALEEFPQNYLSKVSENLGMQQAVPSTPLTQGAMNEALGGFVAGGIMGAGFGSVSPRDKSKPLPEDNLLGRIDPILRAGNVDEAVKAFDAATGDLPAKHQLAANELAAHKQQSAAGQKLDEQLKSTEATDALALAEQIGVKTDALPIQSSTTSSILGGAGSADESAGTGVGGTNGAEQPAGAQTPGPAAPGPSGLAHEIEQAFAQRASGMSDDAVDAHSRLTRNPDFKLYLENELQRRKMAAPTQTETPNAGTAGANQPTDATRARPAADAGTANIGAQGREPLAGVGSPTRAAQEQPAGLPNQDHGNVAQAGPVYETQKLSQPPPDTAATRAPVSGAASGVVVTPIKTGSIRTGYSRVTTPAEAAHTLASLRKSPQEKFQILALDKDDKPIAVLHLTKGATQQVSAPSESVAKAVFQTPGVAKIWYAHNHPSGSSSPSREDMAATKAISHMFGPGTGVTVAGHVVIAGKKFGHMDAGGTILGQHKDIPPMVRKTEVPVTERTVRKEGTLLGGKPVLNSRDAKNLAREATGDKPGIVFLNTQLQVVGVHHLSPQNMAQLRNGRSARDFFSKLGETNATSFMAYLPEHESQSTAAMAFSNLKVLSRVTGGLAMIDAIHGDRSSAEDNGGDIPAHANLTYFQRGREPATPMDKPRVTAIAKAITDTWKNAPNVVVADTIDDLPERVREQNKRQVAKGAESPKAVRVGNTIYVLASQMGAPRDVISAIAHEGLGHWGLNAFYSHPDLLRILNDIIADRPDQVKAKTLAIGLNPNIYEHQLAAAEEVLVDLAERRPSLNIVQRLIAFVRNFLRKIDAVTQWSDNDLIHNFVIPARRFVEEGKVAAMVTQPNFNDFNFQRTKPLWRSELGEFIQDKGPGNATGQVWVNTLDSWAKQGKFKPAELEWSGLREWLAIRSEVLPGATAQTTKIPKTEVLDYLLNYGVQLRETHLSNDYAPHTPPRTIGPAPANRWLQPGTISDRSELDFSFGNWETREEDSSYLQERALENLRSDGPEIAYSSIYESVVDDLRGDLAAEREVEPEDIKPDDIWIRAATTDPQNTGEIEDLVAEYTRRQDTGQLPLWPENAGEPYGLDQFKLFIGSQWDRILDKATEAESEAYYSDPNSPQSRTIIVHGPDGHSIGVFYQDNGYGENTLQDHQGREVDGDMGDDPQVEQNIFDHLAERNVIRIFDEEGPIPENANAHNNERFYLDTDGAGAGYDLIERDTGSVYESFDQLSTALAAMDRANSPMWLTDASGSMTTEEREINKDIEKPVGKPKWQSYNLDDAENIREILVNLPMPRLSREEMAELQNLNDSYKGPLSDAQRQRQLFLTRKTEAAYYNTTHWSGVNDTSAQANVLHIRTSQRLDNTGSKVLFIEEIQSDWAQQGHLHGFEEGKPEITQGEVAELYQAAREALRANDNLGFDSPTEAADAVRTHADWAERWPDVPPEQIQIIQNYVDLWHQFQNQDSSTRLPHGPFVQSTDSWLTLGLKRAIMYAVDNDFAKVAWSSGAQQTGRWGTQEVAWVKQSPSGWRVSASGQKGGVAGGIDLEGEARARGLLKEGRGQFVVEKADLRALIDRITYHGEDDAAKMTDKIWARMQKEDAGVAHPREEGMKEFYDKILVKNADKLVKKFGGKVETVNFIKQPEFGPDNPRFTVKHIPEGTYPGDRDTGGTFTIQDNFINHSSYLYNTRSEAQEEADHKNEFYQEEFRSKRISNVGEQQGFAITESMRKQTEQGMPMFQRHPASWDVHQRTWFENVTSIMQNKHIDTKTVVDAIKTWAGQVADILNPYLQEELFHGRVAKRIKDFAVKELKPLLQEMMVRKVSIPDFEEFLWNRHAEEYNVQIARINPTMPDKGSGITTADARAYLAALTPAQRRAYDALALKFDAITKETRETMVRYGLESRDTINAWEATYQYYAPFMREDAELDVPNMGIGQGYSVKGPASKRAMGSERNVVHILANMAEKREITITRGEKNRVSLALLGLATMFPKADFWRIDKLPLMRYPDPTTGLVTTRVDPQYKQRANVVVARVVDSKGNVRDQAVVFDTHNPRAMQMAAALKNLDVDQLPIALAVSGRATRWFAAMNTQYNPIFGIVNIIRDTQQSMFTLTTTPIAGHQAEVFKHTIQALVGIYIDIRDVRKGITPTSAYANLYEEYQRQGGQTGYRDMFFTSRERAEAIAKEFKSMQKGGATHLGGKAFAFVRDWISDYNEAMENAVRLSAYKVAKDNGQNPQQAASIAKNITVNFNRKGQIGSQMGSLWAFFNANVQGTKRTYDVIMGPKGKQIVLGGMLLGVIQAIALAAAGFDDDEPPEWLRERNLIIPLKALTGEKNYITIPMPLGLHVLPNIGRLAAEFVMSNKRHPLDKVANLMSVIADAFNPLGSAGLVQTLTPTVADPIVGLAENKDWAGRSIALEDHSNLAPTPGFTRAKDTATLPSKWLAQALNWMTGGTSYTPGKVSPTPDQIDYLMGQIAGGVGRELTHAGQTANAAITGEDIPPYKIPGVGRFYGNSDIQSAQVGKFYSNVKLLNEHEAEIKGRLKEGRPVDDYNRANPEARFWQEGNAVETQVRELRQQKRALIAREAPKDEVKAKDEQILSTMKRLNDRIKEAREAEKAAVE